MPVRSFTSALQANTLRQCNASGCRLPRHSLTRYCKDHGRTAKRYGHPHGRPLRPSLWSQQRAAVRELFQSHPDHPGLVAALAYLTGWVAKAVADPGAYKGADEVKRLAVHGVKPVDMLMELCAVSAYLKDNPRAVPDDRSWDFALSHALLKLAPRPRRQTRGPNGYWPVTVKVPANRSYAPKARQSALGYLGTHLRQTLAPLIVNVGLSIRTPEDRERARVEAMQVPFR